MATPHDSKFFEVIESHEVNEVFDVTLIGSLCMWVLEISEPFMLIWNIRKSLELISGERAFLKFWEKIGFHSQVLGVDESILLSVLFSPKVFPIK